MSYSELKKELAMIQEEIDRRDAQSYPIVTRDRLNASARSCGRWNGATWRDPNRPSVSCTGASCNVMCTSIGMRSSQYTLDTRSFRFEVSENVFGLPIIFSVNIGINCNGEETRTDVYVSTPDRIAMHFESREYKWYTSNFDRGSYESFMEKFRTRGSNLVLPEALELDRSGNRRPYPEYVRAGEMCLWLLDPLNRMHLGL